MVSRFLSHFFILLVSALSTVSFPGKSVAQGLPLFDAHIHYNQPDWAVYSPETILKLFDQAGVRWAMVSSTPDDGTLRLFGKAPDRIVPILRPYRTDRDRGSWTQDETVLSYVEERLKRGIYKGIGEFHLSASQTDYTVVRGFAKLAAAKDIFLYAHTDDAGVENLLRMDPKVKILWAHAGLSVGPGKIGPLLDAYPLLRIELSLRESEIAPGDRLDAAWRELFLRHPDRFLVGSDTWTTSRWESLAAIHSGFRQWLNQLPRDVAEKIAFKNGLRLSGRSE